MKHALLFHGWARPAGLAMMLVTAAALRADVEAPEPDAQPRILSIEHRGPDLILRASAPAGVARLLLESCTREDLAFWVPRAVIHPEPGTTEVTFRVPIQPGLELFRIRADATSPLPARLFAGPSEFPGEPASETSGPDAFRGNSAAPPGAEDGGGAREVVESDIWVVRGDTLYFFNQYRGFQRIDISNPDAPTIEGTFPLPGMGEQMYVLESGPVILLAHDPCRQWGFDAESAVILVDAHAVTPLELARLPLPGRVVESRLVGTALYVATETWRESADGRGTWESGTWVSSFDLSDPARPVARSPLWYPGSGNVVTATDRFLFVAITDFSRPWPWRSDLRVADISAPDGTLTDFTRIPLPGRVADKFKIDLAGDVLRVVTEATESSTNTRWVTVLETYRLADPRAVPAVPYTPLDRLELARGERLFATRFDGDRAYLVTFLVIDPLWVIDLSDPAHLRITGELEIPGWSTYIRPLGDRLVTLGIDDTSGWRVAVQLFDVSDPAHPTLLAKVPLGENASWSEANHDEKAFGIFPDAGLLLVPVSEWTSTESRHGVQLIDFDRNTLTARGRLEGDSLVPRRATFHQDRVLAVSGRQLTAADIRDRDMPLITATLELAYPVERLLVAEAHLLEFAGHSLRIRPNDSDHADATASVAIELGGPPVIGAFLRGNTLELLQGRPAQVSWNQEPGTDNWIATTNPGVLVASSWDASRLPSLTRRGESRVPTDQNWLYDFRAFPIDPRTTVWASSGSGQFWGWGRPMWTDALISPFPDARRPGLWYPWWYGSARWLVAVAHDSDSLPAIVSQTQLGSDTETAGEVFAVGPLIYSSRHRHESEVVGTNTFVETVWFPPEPRPSPDADDGSEPRADEGEWRRVTNSYPVLRWWSRHELDVTDFSGDPARPGQRPPASLPGELAGVSHQGALLYTVATRTPDEKSPARVILEALAYDGLAAHLVDGLEIADHSLGQTHVLSIHAEAGLAYVARGGWQADARQRLEVWHIDGEGRWTAGSTQPLPAAPGELRRFGDVLLARSGGELSLFDISAPDAPGPLPSQPPPACFGGELSRGDGDRDRGIWLPLGEYGSVRVGP